MLEIINNLEPFFEDCYRRINVREYSRHAKMSPPTASKLLNDYFKEGLLRREHYRNYIFFYANNKSRLFIDLSRIYWSHELNKLADFLNKKLVSPAVILFGSLAKGESKQDSDIDLAVFAYKKEINLEGFEKILKRKIQVHWFKSIQDIKNKELASSIVNGYLINGRLKF